MIEFITQETRFRGLIAIDLEQRINEELGRPERLTHMREAFRLVVSKQAEKGGRIPDLAGRKERLRVVRERSVGNQDLHEQAIEALEENGFKVRFAADAGEAVSMVAEELGDEKLLVKSKTNLSKEIGLTHALEERGVEVIETDIGDRVIQLSGEETVHPTGPCCHLDRHDIARVLSERLERDLEPEPDRLIEAVKEDINDYVDRAKVGLSGVNAVTAQEGAVVLTNNEANIEVISLRPLKHIMLASVDKIYPDLEEAMNMIKLQAFYATGEQLTSSVRIIVEPSKTADIEKKLFRGVHGPGELVIIFIDNGRTRTLEREGGRELLYCIGCGGCLLECPPYDRFGPLFGRKGRLGGPGVCLSLYFSGPEEAAESGLSLCATCGACVARCPVEIGIPSQVEGARADCVVDGLLIPEHMMVIDNLKKEGNVLGEPKAERGNWAEGLKLKDINNEEAEVLFHAGCRFSYDPDAREAVRAAVELLLLAGVDLETAGGEEACCGGRAFELGYRGEAENYAEDMAARVRASGAKTLVTPCSDCYACFRYIYPRMGRELPVEVLHVTELLARLMREGRLSLSGKVPLKATYHDPCHLGRMGEDFMRAGRAEAGEESRGGGVYDPPRDLLFIVSGLELVEMERTREHTWCCGAGGGIMEAYPELCSWTAKERVEEALSTGAKALVTACPWCERAFRDVIAEDSYDLELYDVCEILLRASGLEKG